MLDRTDLHFRALIGVIAPSVRLYTEMVVAGASLHRLQRGTGRAPVAAQLAGLDPVAVAEAAVVAQRRGFDEINLNCGCPGPAARAGGYGAVAMRDPAAVAAVVEAITQRVRLPVSVKCRLSTHPEWDADAQLAELDALVAPVAAAGCHHFIVHARTAHLRGLCPRANRTVPPLDPEAVYRFAVARPALTFEINGGVRTVAQGRAHLACSAVAAVMVGRAAYDDPLMLAAIERPHRSRIALLAEVSDAMARYIDAQREHGVAAWAVVRHMLALPRGLPGARRIRTELAALCHDPDADGRAVHAILRHGAATAVAASGQQHAEAALLTRL